MEWAVYNLEFRPNSTRLEIDGYTFERVPDYRDRHSKLQFLVSVYGAEFNRVTQTGGHSHTANVRGPVIDPPAIIPWAENSATALEDILLLLRLFTGRDVFKLDKPENSSDKPFAIIADPREFVWGGNLACSIPYSCEKKDDPYDTVDTTLQVHLPQIYERMKDAEWQRTYKNGYFLVLLNQAIQQRTIEAAFGQCWTIWEHLFACLNDSWMSSQTLHSLSSKEKIAFLLVHYGVRIHLKENEKSRLDALVRIRNRLVHFGRLPEHDKVYSDAEMFIRMTEYIAAKALGLYPSNIFDAVERFEEFLLNNQKQNGQ